MAAPIPVVTPSLAWVARWARAQRVVRRPPELASPARAPVKVVPASLYQGLVGTRERTDAVVPRAWTAVPGVPLPVRVPAQVLVSTPEVPEAALLLVWATTTMG
ncbi:MAG: hypothetical protein V3T56_07930 [Gemmatimonadales bacterium]